MISKGNTTIKSVHLGSTPIKSVYKGSQLIWSSATNLFNWTLTPSKWVGYNNSTKVISPDGSQLSITNSSGVSGARCHFSMGSLLDPSKRYRFKVICDTLRPDGEYFKIGAEGYYSGADLLAGVDTPAGLTDISGIMYFTEYAVGTVTTVKCELYEI